VSSARLLRPLIGVFALLAFSVGACAQFAPLIIYPAPPPGPPVPLQQAVVGKPYLQFLGTNGSDPQTAWSVVAGALPAGLSLDPIEMVLYFAGTPTTVGTYVFTIQAIDANAGTATQRYSITVVPALTITNPSTLPSATSGALYTETMTAANGTPPYTWVLNPPPGLTTGRVSPASASRDRRIRPRASVPPDSASSPPGMTLGGSSGVLAGIPTESGTFSFDVQVSDSSSSFPQVDVQPFTLTVNPAPAITSPSVLPAGTVGAAYSTALAVQGGTSPLQWSLVEGTPPPGLTLSPAGVIGGTPTETGTYTFSASVRDRWGATSNASFSITIAPGLLITTPSPLPPGSVGTPYSLQFAVSGGATPYTWAIVAGALPSGLTLSTAGLLSGTPQMQEGATVVIQVSDASGKVTRGTFTMIITSLAFVTQSLPAGTVNTPYSQMLAATGGTPPYTWAVLATATAAVGGLPPGLTLNPTTGLVSGNPTATGTFPFVIQLTDSTKTTITHSFTIVISLSISPPSLPGGTAGTAYPPQTLTVTGGTQPYTFTISSGTLPAGITLGQTTGVISGTPTAIGSSQFTVMITDASQLTATEAYTLVIAAPPLSTPTIGGVNDTEPPAQQPTISLELAESYPLALTGTITLTFAPAPGNVDDPAIQFAGGGRTVSFSVAQGDTTAVFPSANSGFSTGTVAGTITLTMSFQAGGQDVTPQPAPTRVIQIPAQAPVITRVTATPGASGIEVDVTGFSNTREMVSATFQFQAASGTTLQGSQVTITADQLFATWYSDANSDQYGSQFTYAQSFTLSGNTSGIAGVSVTLTNKQGTSASASATVQ